MPEAYAPITILLGLFSIPPWIMWYASLASVVTLGPPPRERIPLYVTPPLCAVGLVGTLVLSGVTLWLLAAVIGFLGVVLLLVLTPLLGIEADLDVAERRNVAAAWVICGEIVALTICFAVPPVERATVPDLSVVRSILAAMSLLGVWLVLELIAAPNEAVTVGRDVAVGRWLAGFLIAEGLLLGHLASDSFTDLWQTAGKLAAIPGLFVAALLVRYGAGGILFVAAGVAVFLLMR
jgi:hypothetical protein